MTYEAFLGQVRRVLEDALDRLGQDQTVLLEVPPDPRMGDIAATVAFALAKKTRQRPLDMAEQILANISIDPESLIDRVEANGPVPELFH